jgi:hypothetical protein
MTLYRNNWDLPILGFASTQESAHKVRKIGTIIQKYGENVENFLGFARKK